MHLPGYPHYYVKDGERVVVYFTGEARDLRATGWVREESKPVKVVEPEPELVAQADTAEEIQVDVVIDAPEQVDQPEFEFMTKPELLAYALERGVDLPNNALKAELVEACKKLG